MDPDQILQGKRIIVTGGASGIGLGAATLFGRLGAKVFIADLDEKALQQTSVEALAAGYCAGDVTIEADCERMVEQAVLTMGGLDGLFHSAGISDPVARALDLDIDAWQRVVDVNLRGAFLICRAVGRRLVDQRAGAIVTLSSVNGWSGIPRRHAYGPAKAAVAGLTRTLACEWGEPGVRVNCIAPGYIKTPMVKRLVEEGKIDVDRLERRTPLARLGEVDEIGRVAAFLLSDWASYVTGAIVPVDGGWTAYGGSGDVQTA